MPDLVLLQVQSMYEFDEYWDELPELISLNNLVECVKPHTNHDEVVCVSQKGTFIVAFKDVGLLQNLAFSEVGFITCYPVEIYERMMDQKKDKIFEKRKNKKLPHQKIIDEYIQSIILQDK